jgi:AcrR family transcriptional regulator
MLPRLGGDTSKYADTDRYVNTLEHVRTEWYLWAMQARLNRQERKSQTRERLLDAAAEVFARRGFETATLDEVAAAAGYTKGAVYSNFASKTDLFIALIERRVEGQSEEYLERFGGQDLETVARTLEYHYETESERQWLVLAVEFWLHAMRDDRARALMAEQYERARTFVAADLIAPAYARSGQEPPLAPRDLAIVIESLGIGLALQAALDPGAVRLSLEAEVLVKLLGLPVPPAESRPPDSSG